MTDPIRQVGLHMPDAGKADRDQVEARPPAAELDAHLRDVPQRDAWLGNARSLSAAYLADGHMDVGLLDGHFDAAAELAGFTDRHPESGGVVSFLGQVRDAAGDGADPVLALELTHYAPLTLPGMEALAHTIAARWPIDGLLMLHRIGTMVPGDPIVLVAVAARHRRSAFAAADFAMDQLKSRAWFWKRERTAAGWRWVEPRAEDLADLARWLV